MKGQFFIEIAEGRFAGQGQILADVGRGFFQVRFFAPPGSPAVTRVLPAERLGNFFLFDDMKQAETWLKQQQDAAQQQQGQPGTKLEDMSVKELRGLAEANGIDLGGARKKADIIEAIVAGAEASGGE